MQGGSIEGGGSLNLKQDRRVRSCLHGCVCGQERACVRACGCVRACVRACVWVRAWVRVRVRVQVSCIIESEGETAQVLPPAHRPPVSYTVAAAVTALSRSQPITH